MSRKMTRRCVRIFDDTWTELGTLSKANGDSGVNVLVRTILDSYVRQMTALRREKLDAVKPVDIDLSSIEFDPADFAADPEDEICEVSNANNS